MTQKASCQPLAVKTDFKSPDEWLGEEGEKYRVKIFGRHSRMGVNVPVAWRKFKAERQSLSWEEIEAELQRLAETDPAPRVASMSRRRRTRRAA